MKHTSIRILAIACATLPLLSLGGCGAASAVYSLSPHDVFQRSVEQAGSAASDAVNASVANTAGEIGNFVTETIVKSFPPVR